MSGYCLKKEEYLTEDDLGFCEEFAGADGSPKEIAVLQAIYPPVFRELFVKRGD